MKIDGSTVWITGTARLGGDLAVALARDGASVNMVYRSSRKAAENAMTVIKAFGGKAAVHQCDVSDPKAVQDLFKVSDELDEPLHVLINMASRYQQVPFDKLDAAEWDAAMNADARGAYLMSLAAAPRMRRSGGGRIINFSDWVAASGRPRYPGYVTYYTAKKAVIGLTEALALELAPDILVNAIAPGPILAPPEMGEEEQREVEKATPVGRWGGAEEIVKAVKFLIETDFVTGECIRVDGGRHLK